MKQIVSLFVAVILMATISKAQSKATAIANAKIVTPISIVKNTDLNFGNIAVQATTGGQVILSPNSSRTRTSGVTLPAITGTVSAAGFTITGESNYTYSITLPTSLTLTHSAGSKTMMATSFTSNPVSTGLLTNGTQNITVGATLTVSAAQLAGVYTSGTFDVTVTYN